MLDNIEAIILFLLMLGVIPYTYLEIKNALKERDINNAKFKLEAAELRRQWEDMIKDIDENSSTRK